MSIDDVASLLRLSSRHLSLAYIALIDNDFSKMQIELISSQALIEMFRKEIKSNEDD